MKLLPIAFLALSFGFGAASFAQAPAAPAKPKSLSSTDRPLARDILENLYFVDTLVTAVQHRKAEEPNLLPEAAWASLAPIGQVKNNLWGDIAPLVQLSGDKLPAALDNKDKKRIAVLTPPKAGDAKPSRSRRDDKKGDFGTEWAKLVCEQSRELTKLLEKGSKSMDPQISQLNVKWGAEVKAVTAQLEPIAGPSK
jgi:hypothetical protein